MSHVATFMLFYSLVSFLHLPFFVSPLQSPSWRGLWQSCTVDKVSTCSCRQMEPLMEQRRRTMVTVRLSNIYFATFNSMYYWQDCTSDITSNSVSTLWQLEHQIHTPCVERQCSFSCLRFDYKCWILLLNCWCLVLNSSQTVQRFACFYFHSCG